jgi:hypothetical protein
VIYFCDFHNYPCLFLQVHYVHLPFFYFSSNLLRCNNPLSFIFSFQIQFPSAIFSFILYYLTSIIKDNKSWVKKIKIKHNKSSEDFELYSFLYKYQVWWAS